jgi:hypothetical protein
VRHRDRRCTALVRPSREDVALGRRTDYYTVFGRPISLHQADSNDLPVAANLPHPHVSVQMELEPGRAPRRPSTIGTLIPMAIVPSDSTRRVLSTPVPGNQLTLLGSETGKVRPTCLRILSRVADAYRTSRLPMLRPWPPDHQPLYRYAIAMKRSAVCRAVSCVLGELLVGLATAVPPPNRPKVMVAETAA